MAENILASPPRAGWGARGRAASLGGSFLRARCLATVPPPDDEAEADQVAHAIQAAGDQAGRITFGKTPVRFPFGIAKVHSYADAK